MPVSNKRLARRSFYKLNARAFNWSNMVHSLNDIVILLREQRKESTRLFTQLQQDIAALQGYVDAKIDSLVASSNGSSSESNGKLPLDLSVSLYILYLESTLLFYSVILSTCIKVVQNQCNLMVKLGM